MTSSLMMIYLKLVMTMAVWGGTFIAGRALAQVLPPFSAALWRFAIASLGMAALVYQQGDRLPLLKSNQILPVLILGLSGVLAYNAFFFAGLQTVPAGRAGLIIALNPVCIMLCAAIALREFLSGLKLAGTALSLVGTGLILTNGDIRLLTNGGIGRGELLLLGCVLSWSIYSLTGKQVMRSLSPRVATTYAVWVGTVALVPFALSENVLRSLPRLTPLAGGSILYLGLLGTVMAFIWYYEGIQALGAGRASIFINLVPVFAVIFGVLFLQEQVTLSLLIGGALVILGVSAVNWPQGRVGMPQGAQPRDR